MVNLAEIVEGHFLISWLPHEVGARAAHHVSVGDVGNVDEFINLFQVIINHSYEMLCSSDSYEMIVDLKGKKYADMYIISSIVSL